MRNLIVGGWGWGWGHDRRVVAPQILKSVLELQEVKENVAEDETHPEPACVSTKPRAT